MLDSKYQSHWGRGGTQSAETRISVRGGSLRSTWILVKRLSPSFPFGATSGNVPW